MKSTPQPPVDLDRLDRLLDAALAATFPASDPVSVGTAGESEPLGTGGHDSANESNGPGTPPSGAAGGRSPA